MGPLSLQGQIDSARREIAKRREVYPHLVSARKMKQAAADYEIGAMQSVLKTLLWLQRHNAVIVAAVEAVEK